MHVAVYVALVTPVVLVPCLRMLAPRLPPRFASWLLVLTMAVVGAGSTASLVILQAGGLVKSPVALAFGRWSAEVLARDDAVGVPVGVGASIALLASIGAAGHALLNWSRSLAATRREVAGAGGHAGLTVVADPDPYAYAVAGAAGTIVVSSGMLRALSAAERRALLAHERAHLASRHDLLHATAMLAVRLNPLLIPLRGTLSFTIERWADESAAHSTGDRRATASAIGKAALLGRAGRRPPVAATAATAGPVPRRVHALLEPPPAFGLRGLLRSVRGLVCVGAVVLVATSGLATLEAASDLRHALETAEIAEA